MVITVIRPVFTPMSVAASLSCAVARMERPRSVFMRNRNIPTVNATAMKNAMVSGTLKEIPPRKKVELE
jgi:hypothetical protein